MSLSPLSLPLEHFCCAGNVHIANVAPQLLCSFSDPKVGRKDKPQRSWEEVSSSVSLLVLQVPLDYITQDRVITLAWGICPFSITLCEMVSMRTCEKWTPSADTKSASVSIPKILISLKSLLWIIFKEFFEKKFYFFHQHFLRKAKNRV